MTSPEKIFSLEPVTGNEIKSEKMYDELASWWHLLSSPEDYSTEAAIFRRILRKATKPPPKTLLELGSGGGNNASHLKNYFRMTLVDRSPGMLATSKTLNPECEHIEGDMRSVRLEQEFDAVFIHDAIGYMTTENDLLKAFTTAFVHCRPSGAALFVPDHVKENFTPTTKCGGHDKEGRGLRYLEWVYDPDGTDSTYISDFAFLLRESRTKVQVIHDRHENGLFPRAKWLELLSRAGFQSFVIPDSFGRELFLGIKNL